MALNIPLTNIVFHINHQFITNVPLLYPLKKPENRRFSNVSKGYRNEALVENRLIWELLQISIIDNDIDIISNFVYILISSFQCMFLNSSHYTTLLILITSCNLFDWK